MTKKIIKMYDVTVEPTKEDLGDELSNTFFRSCSFCSKMVKVSSSNFRSCINLGGKRFFCPFCIRNNFHFRSSRNVLGLSYRSIIGHYYHKHYLKHVTKKLFLNQIQDCIDNHIRVGLRSPVFSYDADTYMWFLDFNRVGKDSRKAPCAEVLATAKTMLYCFGLSKVYGSWVFNNMWEKYDTAIKLFYEKRQRPKNKRMLVPTLKGVGAGHSENSPDHRSFVPSMLELVP